MIKKHFLLVIMVLSWSIYYVVCDFLIDNLETPYFVGFLLRTVTFIILTIFFIKNKMLSFKIQNRECIVMSIVVALLAFSFDCLINIGLQYSNATSGTALLKTEMIFVILVTFLIGNNKIGISKVLLVSLMSIGAFLITLKDFGSFSVDKWSLLFVLSALLNTICAFLIKKTQVVYRLSSYQIVYINNFTSWLLYLFMTLLFDVGRCSGWDCFFDLKIVLAFAFCGICQTTLMLTYYKALKEYQVWVVKTILLLVPILTMIINIVFLGEYITLLQTVGFFIIILSSLAIIVYEMKAVKKT